VRIVISILLFPPALTTFGPEETLSIRSFNHACVRPSGEANQKPNVAFVLADRDLTDGNQAFGFAHVAGDDPDGCCIQWTPVQAKGCSANTKRQQCKDDAESVNASWDWHAGACEKEDCPPDSK
jgi:hypothetical protein